MTAPAFDRSTSVPAPLVPLAVTETVVKSECFGTLRVASEDLLTFAGGLYGFPECRRFVLLPAGDGLFWLQSAEHGSLFFLLADPFQAMPGYAVDLGSADRLALAVHGPDEVAIFAIVTLRPEGGATINLQGPVAVNLRTRQGRQLAVAESVHGVSTPFTVSPLE